MEFHPWALLWGVDFLGLSMLTWMSPFVMDGPADDGLSQFMGRFFYPIFGVIFVVGPFMKPHEAIPEDVVLPIWLRFILILWLAVDIYLYVRLQRQRYRWKVAASEQPPESED